MYARARRLRARFELVLRDMAEASLHIKPPVDSPSPLSDVAAGSYRLASTSACVPATRRFEGGSRGFFGNEQACGAARDE